MRKLGGASQDFGSLVCIIAILVLASSYPLHFSFSSGGWYKWVFVCLGWWELMMERGWSGFPLVWFG